jgi:hypothetical protein
MSSAAPDLLTAAPGPAAPPLLTRRSQTAFIVVVVVLLLAAVGLNTAVVQLQLHFKKQPVPVRQSLKTVMPATVGQWVQVAKDTTLDPDILAALGTNEFLFCSYINATEVGRSVEDLRKEFEGLNFEDQKNKLVRLQQGHPSAVVSLALTYYTGKADTVAHIPERCYIAGGFEPTDDPRTLRWAAAGQTLDARFITFENQVSRASQKCNVAYFFHVNGKYTASSLVVRSALQNLFERYGYYAKVELKSDSPDAAAAEKSMQEFLGAALPEIEKAWPDWSAYQGRR